MKRLSLIALLIAACASEPRGAETDAVSEAPAFPGDADGDGKADTFGRALVGVASPFLPDEMLDEERLRTEHRHRREVAWRTLARVLDPVPLLGLQAAAGAHPEVRLPDNVPQVPRWETWYGVDDFKRMFQHLYEDLGPSGRAARTPFDARDIDAAFEWNAGALSRSTQWPLDRYFRYVNDLGVCAEGISPEACAREIHSKFSGATLGTARVAYSPGVVRHLLGNYHPVLDCLARLDQVKLDEQPVDAANFTACFESELPSDAALVKAQWVRSDFERQLPVWDTDAESMRRRISENGAANWGEEGDRQLDPGADEIYAIKLRNGSEFRLAGLHVMTKELRHWQWITLWWSDTPDEDFGADRPAAFRDAVPAVFHHYKMCAVSWYEEDDADPSAEFADHPTLAAALRVISRDGAGAPTWCSNPYIEHGVNNARTNCIGCHQHAGGTVAHDQNGDGSPDAFVLENVIEDEARFPLTGRAQMRNLFPADYLYSFNRVDALSQIVRSEVTFFDRADADAAAPRVPP